MRSRKRFSLEQAVDIGLKILSCSCGSNKHDRAFFINKDNCWDGFDPELLVNSAFRISNEIVFNVSPTVVRNMFLDFVSSLIQAKPNDAHLVFPVFALQQHLLVVTHWSLTRRTPRCPKVQQPHLSCFVLNVAELLFSHYVSKRFDCSNLCPF